MLGRDGEREQLTAFARSVEGRTLLLRGETGVGKSTLLDFAAELAAREGQLVVRATGVEAESELPYAGLHQLLYPLLAHTTGLDDTSRAALGAVFGQTGGTPPSLMSLGIAALGLLSAAALEQPLFLVLDDAQWLDDSSAAVCGFIGRRLTGSRLKLLLAVRSDIASPFDTAALPELAVGPLSEEDSALLLDGHHPSLERRLRRIVLNQAQGNPLALLELPGHAGGPTDDRPPADPLSLRGASPSRRLRHLYGTRITGLAAGVRAELLKGALDGVAAGSGDGPVPAGRYRMRDADEAVVRGLLVIEPSTGEFAFRHPLVRSSVVQLATPGQRREAHRTLARLHRGDLERRAAHLAEATLDPDEEVARVLEAAAESATRRGGALTAVTWLTRAAELSEHPAERSRRLGDAAFIAGHAARLGHARRLLRADPGPDSDRSPAAALASGYQALYQDGDVRSTHRQISAVVERLADRRAADRTDAEDPDGAGGTDGTVLDRLLALLLATSQFAADRALWERTHALLAALGDRVGERARIYSATWSDVVRHGAGWTGPVERAAADLPGQEPWDVARLAVSAYHLDVLSPLRPHLQRVVSRELETGAVSAGMVMLHLIMLDQMGVGEWEAAERTGGRALRHSDEHGHELFAQQTRAYLAQIAAMRGQTAAARELQAVVDAWARPRGIGFLTQLADAAGATAALSDGDYEGAYLHAIGITAPGVFQPYAHQASRTLLDLVEAAVHTGRAAQARAHALAARDANLPAVSPRLALVTHGALAMTADGEQEAAEAYALAVDHPAAARFPFELARIRLAHGIRVRRTQGATAARQFLAPAADAFERLGATAWAARARAELRVSGVPARPATRTTSLLTWQERRIADLAAGGLTNKEIGERTRLSPRTVSAHLYRIFPKLDITTRAALRDALTRLDEDAATPNPALPHHR
ncbi:helix-turn-helix transcriptional regulator [Streptomyces sp. CBMA123]|uniref:helix-turn-helix transcriptional regulator n=1 Tax=Streptomyces sp. CBMA123 TaxID=1896313 RepID=UPI001661C7CF|nr:helix-turn-helix transcriptional regulator [Streptomyces sp. CBMA123]MBD0694621.1 LuxR family transcriptional regulator [Streptomyces sp. CBMA123]